MSADTSSKAVSARGWGRTLLRLIGPAIFILLIVFVVDIRSLGEIIWQSNPWLFGAGVLLVLGGISLRGMRWMTLHGICGLDPVGVFYQLRLAFASAFAAQLLPPPASPFSRIMLLARDGHAPGRALAVLVLEKIADGSIFVLFGTFGTLYLSIVVPSAARVTAVVVTAAAVAAGVWLTRHRARELVYRLLARVRHRIGAATLAELKRTLRATSPARLGVIAALSLVIGSLQATVTITMARSIGIEAPAIFIVAAWGLAALTVLVPFSINGIGMREGVYVATLATVGVSRDRAFALSLVILAATFIASTPGAIEWMVRLAFPQLSSLLTSPTPSSALRSPAIVEQPPERRSAEHP